MMSALSLVSSVDSDEISKSLNNRIDQLSAQIQRLENENDALISKLREAMSAKPAGFNPDELVRAEQQIFELQKVKQLHAN